MVAGMTPIHAAVALTRAWTRLYTWRLSTDVAIERQLEIASDVWEMVHDDDTIGDWRKSTALFARLMSGAADDIAWRLEQGALEEQLLVRRAVAVIAAGMLVVGLWSIPAVFAGGMRNVNVCAGELSQPETTPDFRFELVRCTGAFFRSKQ